MNNHQIKNKSLGETYIDNDNYFQAINWFQENIENENQKLNNYFHLGLAYLLSDEIETAEALWMSILLESDNFEYDLQNLLTILDRQGVNQLQKNNFIQALKIYNKIHELLINENRNKPHWGSYYYHFGLVFQGLNDHNNAIKAYTKAIEININLIDSYNNLGNIYLFLNQPEKAEFIYQEAIKINPNHSGTYFNLFLTLKELGKVGDAIALAEKASQLFPDDFVWKLQKNLFLPIIYSTEEEIKYYRQKFTKGLDNLIINLDLSTDIKKKNALKAISNHTNFYLAYQGLNDLDLQKKYGELVTKITSINYPQWIKYNTNFGDKESKKIKLGFVTGGSSNRAKWLLKWLENLDKNIFHIYVYIIENINYSIGQNFEKIADFYYLIPDNFEKSCQKISEDKLDVLTYTEIGMLPQTILMGSLRLAAIQCSTIGHPLTSGLSNIDYYISRELMEIQEAQNYYSEKLFVLPNIGMCLEKKPINNVNKSRKDFNLDHQSIIYLCSQMLFKYLPQHDYLFSAIAKKVDNSKFIFIESYPYLTKIFQERLDKVFSKYDLNFKNYCVFLPSLSQDDYFNLNLLSDVFLDSLAWSGDNTTREALSCHLPVVTLPREFMRTRHSYGILKMLEVTETIANSEKEYIQIAVKLGLDRAYNQMIREKIKVKLDRLYEDLECVKALEKFYLQMNL
ncbi:O-linked N-acetylglucosamine transferase, SPINDLY family protein [Geminocystis herdmanii]|uniref:O-linked N-acetylglucosamine transferase, SPINDLY family protein n=1 Tax=Geminocystis herdmanii TaxID=669359 RepID=UPI000347DC00|nr:tetratricopeptide repeat protein [Geminocystis herdmanii]